MNYTLLEKFDMFLGGRVKTPLTLESLKNVIAAQRIAVADAKTDYGEKQLLVVLDILMTIEENIDFEDKQKKRRKRLDNYVRSR